MMSYVAAIFFACVFYVILEFLVYMRAPHATIFSEFLATRRGYVISYIAECWQAVRRRLTILLAEDSASSPLLGDVTFTSDEQEPLHIYNIGACLQFLDINFLRRSYSETQSQDFTRIQRVYSCLSTSLHSSILRRIEEPLLGQGDDSAIMRAADIAEELAGNEWYWQKTENAVEQPVEIGVTGEPTIGHAASPALVKIEPSLRRPSASPKVNNLNEMAPTKNKTSPNTEKCVNVPVKARTVPAKPPRPSTVVAGSFISGEKSLATGVSPDGEKFRSKKEGSFTKAAAASSELKSKLETSAPLLKREHSYSRMDQTTGKAVPQKPMRKGSEKQKKDSVGTSEDSKPEVKVVSSVLKRKNSEGPSSSTVSERTSLGHVKTSYGSLLTKSTK